jgi:hypothetical protein
VVLVAGGVPGRGTFALLEDGTCMWFPGDAGYQWAQQQHAMHPPFPQIGNSRSGLESPVISGSHFAIASRGTW